MLVPGPIARCGILVEPELTVPEPGVSQAWEPLVLAREAGLGDLRFVRDELAPMDTCYFIGFPGTKKSQTKSRKTLPHYDTVHGLPIARQAIVASMTTKFFENQDLTAAMATRLVSGLSFSGSSGSPVFTPALGIPPNDLITGPYREAKLVGIMSGHLTTDAKIADYEHAGLSYFASSSVVLDLIKKARENEWGPPPEGLQGKVWSSTTSDET